MIKPDSALHITDTLLRFTPPQDALANRVVVISGATGGLGTVLSQACASAGATVVMLGKRLNKLEALYDVIDGINAAPQPAIITLDQSTAPEADYVHLAQTLSSEFGTIDALVHTAADLGAPSPLPDIPQADWSRVMSVNLTSARLLTNACVPLLKKSNSASVTFTTDSKHGAYWGAYGVSKAALLHLAYTYFDETENQQHDSGNPVVAVNTIDPGPMRTPLRRKAFPGELENETPTPDTRIGPFLALICRQDQSLNGRFLKLP